MCGLYSRGYCVLVFVGSAFGSFFKFGLLGVCSLMRGRVVGYGVSGGRVFRKRI